MITLENFDTKKYRVFGAKKRYYLAAGQVLEVDEEELTIVRTYSQIGVISVFLKIMLFLLCIIFVFLDTDYENGEFALVSVKYKCKARLPGLKLTIVPSPLLNINKTGELDSKFIIEKSLLVAHIISVFVYAVAIIALFIFLGIFTSGEVVLSPLFYSLAGISACVTVYIAIHSVKRFMRTVAFLKDHFKDYTYNN